MEELDAQFIERYNQLDRIMLRVANELTPNGIEILLLAALAGRSVRLGIDEVVELLWESESISARDHLIQVHLAGLESYFYRQGYCTSGHMVRILAGNYSVATEEVKQSIIFNGFPFVTATVSSAQELSDVTPLKKVSHSEYSAMFEKLLASWGVVNQKEAERLMWSRLDSIHDALPKHKIGSDFRRERRGRAEPLPMYVRNELHHPTKGAALETEAFEQDKRIGYAIMQAWLTRDQQQDQEEK